MTQIFTSLKISWIAHGMPTNGDIHELLQNWEHLGLMEWNGDVFTNLMDLKFVEVMHAYLLDSRKNLEYMKLLKVEQQQVSKYLLARHACLMVGSHPVGLEGVFILPKLLRDDHTLDEDACSALMAELHCQAFQEQQDPTSPRWDGEKYLYGIPVYDSEEKIADATGIDSLLKLLATVQHPHTHVQSTFHICVVRITWFSCIREFFNAILGAVIVFSIEMNDRLLIWEGQNLASIDDKVYLMGTFPYQAVELLLPSDTTVQGVHHDLESSFWLIWIICINMMGPFDHCITWIIQGEQLHASANTAKVPKHALQSTDNCSTWGQSRQSSATQREGPTKAEIEERKHQASIPSWAKPGGQGLDHDTVAQQKKEMGTGTLNLITFV
ncbi:hypothetical protein PISMIDRAFT_24656 [Pisolithus microcarpus 441]|uniref:Uncharacterized protein n=1 Tax=Pisolithus microcarpus 441 TaxID=765257 RepID=A0A0C9ZES4_9AGAM|nr:hypothetical protein BKA83DRAFT_24656 [Pisolithus microcarpus]KIK18453.1 hypothetical protein PISMIDRAFT_24656 [Pisolithus microcarpus 441]